MADMTNYEKMVVIFSAVFIISMILFCLFVYFGRLKSAIISFAISNVFMALTILSACFMR